MGLQTLWVCNTPVRPDQPGWGRRQRAHGLWYTLLDPILYYPYSRVLLADSSSIQSLHGTAVSLLCLSIFLPFVACHEPTS
jgi:hypothetical protein